MSDTRERLFFRSFLTLKLDMHKQKNWHWEKETENIGGQPTKCKNGQKLKRMGHRQAAQFGGTVKVMEHAPSWKNVIMSMRWWNLFPTRVVGTDDLRCVVHTSALLLLYGRWLLKWPPNAKRFHLTPRILDKTKRYRGASWLLSDSISGWTSPQLPYCRDSSQDKRTRRGGIAEDFGESTKMRSETIRWLSLCCKEM
jgi:hypothetical protein